MIKQDVKGKQVLLLSKEAILILKIFSFTPNAYLVYFTIKYDLHVKNMWVEYDVM